MSFKKTTTFDEMYGAGSTADIQPAYQQIADWITSNAASVLPQKSAAAEVIFRRLGITFAVYGNEGGTERLIPFDVIPRVFSTDEWTRIANGCTQRVRALNSFIHDIYHSREIVAAGVIPESLLLANAQYEPQMHDLDVPGGVYIHIAGIDIVRTGPDEFYVLEDNLRSPSGVSYMLENRHVMMRLFPELFDRLPVLPVDHYPDALLRNLRAVAPLEVSDPTVVVLTPGPFNSAYFEHAFLADEMGVELVSGSDLFVSNGVVLMRTTEGPRRVDVIYRRIDDAFIDPLAFNPESMLGVPGLLSVYRSGRVTVANAMGTGVADDKSIYPYVPDIIRFYLGEEPILQNVPTYVLRREEELSYALEHLEELVVKETHGSGGYGMLVGPTSTAAERAVFAEKIKAAPDKYIAQPTLSLSTCPTLVEQGVAPRHVDLRPYILLGDEATVIPGGLTRVALPEGSLVVNSSQGGGTKDTWVLGN